MIKDVENERKQKKKRFSDGKKIVFFRLFSFLRHCVEISFIKFYCIFDSMRLIVISFRFTIHYDGLKLHFDAGKSAKEKLPTEYPKIHMNEQKKNRRNGKEKTMGTPA